MASSEMESVQDLIDLEAALADAHRYEEWLALWSPEHAAYVVPHGALGSGRREVAIIRDDFERMCERIRRLRSGQAHSQDPPSVLCRVMGRPRLADSDGTARTTATPFICSEVRPERQTTWSGTALHTIDLAGGRPLIRRKEVRLVNAHHELPALTFLI